MHPVYLSVDGVAEDRRPRIDGDCSLALEMNRPGSLEGHLSASLHQNGRCVPDAVVARTAGRNSIDVNEAEEDVIEQRPDKMED